MKLELIIPLLVIFLATWAMVLFLMAVWRIWRHASPQPELEESESEQESAQESE